MSVEERWGLKREKWRGVGGRNEEKMEKRGMAIPAGGQRSW